MEEPSDASKHQWTTQEFEVRSGAESEDHLREMGALFNGYDPDDGRPVLLAEVDLYEGPGRDPHPRSHMSFLPGGNGQAQSEESRHGAADETPDEAIEAAGRDFDGNEWTYNGGAPETNSESSLDSKSGTIFTPASSDGYSLTQNSSTPEDQDPVT